MALVIYLGFDDLFSSAPWMSIGRVWRLSSVFIDAGGPFNGYLRRSDDDILQSIAARGSAMDNRLQTECFPDERLELYLDLRQGHMGDDYI